MATPNIVPRAAGEGGLGAAAKGWGSLFVTNTTTSSATQGGKLILAGDDGAVMDDNHRLGVIEFKGAEDTSSTLSIGARIQAICRDAWDGSNNDADLQFYTTDGTTESLVLTLDADKLATFAGAVSVAGNLTFDSVALTGIQASSESFVDNDISLMTSAAIQDKILAYGYTTATGDITGVDLTGGTNLTVASETGTTSGNYSCTLNVDDAFIKNDADDATTGSLTVTGAAGIIINDATTSSATEGGNLVLASDDGAVQGSGHRLGVIEFKGAEDGSNTITIGARIESITKAAWDSSNNDAKLSFYTSYDDAQQAEKVDIGGNTAMSVYHDYHATTFENQLTADQGGGTILKYSPGGDESPAGSELFFLHTDGTWNQTDADAVATGGSQLLAVGLGASARTTGVLLEGLVRIASTEILNTPGSGAVDGLPLYVSTTAGHFDFTAPSSTGDFVRIVGYAIDDDSSDVLVYFKPDSTYIELA